MQMSSNEMNFSLRDWRGRLCVNLLFSQMKISIAYSSWSTYIRHAIIGDPDDMCLS